MRQIDLAESQPIVPQRIKFIGVPVVLDFAINRLLMV